MNENEIQVVPHDIIPEVLEKNQEIELTTNVASDEQTTFQKPKLTLKKKKVLAALAISLFLFIGSAGYICMNLSLKSIPSEDHLAVNSQPTVETQTIIGVSPVAPTPAVPMERALHQVNAVRTIQSYDQFKAKREQNTHVPHNARVLRRGTTTSLPHAVNDNNPFARSSQIFKNFMARRNKQLRTLHAPVKRLIVHRNLRGQAVRRPVVNRRAPITTRGSHRRVVVLRRRPATKRRAVQRTRIPTTNHSQVIRNKVIVRRNPRIHRVLRRIPIRRNAQRAHKTMVIRQRPVIRRRVPIKRRVVHRPIANRQRIVSHFPQSNTHKGLV